MGEGFFLVDPSPCFVHCRFWQSGEGFPFILLFAASVWFWGEKKRSVKAVKVKNNNAMCNTRARGGGVRNENAVCLVLSWQGLSPAFDKTSHRVESTSDLVFSISYVVWFRSELVFAASYLFGLFCFFVFQLLWLKAPLSWWPRVLVGWDSDREDVEWRPTLSSFSCF